VKNALLYVTAVEVCCPHCACEHPEPKTGSLFWTSDEVSRHAGEALMCGVLSCGKTFLVPAPKATGGWKTEG
jgi:hypothetical protein